MKFEEYKELKAEVEKALPNIEGEEKHILVEEEGKFFFDGTPIERDDITKIGRKTPQGFQFREIEINDISYYFLANVGSKNSKALAKVYYALVAVEKKEEEKKEQIENEEKSN